MTQQPRIAIVPVGISLGAFFVITYLLCVAYGLVAPEQRMHELISMLVPGFSWISWESFLIGLAITFGYGWYIAVIFIPLYNFFASLRGS